MNKDVQLVGIRFASFSEEADHSRHILLLDIVGFYIFLRNVTRNTKL